MTIKSCPHLESDSWCVLCVNRLKSRMGRVERLRKKALLVINILEKSNSGMARQMETHTECIDELVHHIRVLLEEDDGS